jgi:peptide/nickel transport system ATP-binding protein
VQAAVTELLMDIQRENKTTMLFISHDLSVVRYIADRVIVMYLGHIVEQGTTDQIFSPPYHPYTEALLSAIPIADTSVVKKHIVLEGDIPSAMNPPSGCPFQTRCRWKPFVPDNLCERELPSFKELGNGHRSLCWLDDEQLAKMEPVISFKDVSTGAVDAALRPIARRQPTVAGHQPEAPAADAETSPAQAQRRKAQRVARASKAMTGRPGDSAPEKSMTEVGDGREAASAEVRPATARTRPEAAKAKGKKGDQPRPVKTASSPEQARRLMGVADPEPKPGGRRGRSGGKVK